MNSRGKTVIKVNPPFGKDIGDFAGAALIEGPFGDPGVANLELIVNAGGKLVHYFRNIKWAGPVIESSRHDCRWGPFTNPNQKNRQER